MTSVDLDPIVGQKLNHFKRRRVQLLLARGISVGLLTFLVAFTVVAFVDWYWLLSDSTRWTLTVCSYAAVLLAVWFASVSRITKRPTDEEAAVLMENTEPELRENLLSAVELATDQPDAIHDSPVFRGLLQGKVAQQMGHVHVSKLLPFRLVAKWLGAALIVAGAVACLLLAGDARIRKLAVRALMPGANIERISRIQVKVLSPSPASLMMAKDETVAVVVEVTGGTVSEVTLETYTPSQGVLRQPMTGRSKIEFVSNIHLKDEPVEYRIFAGDAITQRFTIDTRSRPHATKFHKEYTYPAYTQLAPRNVSETHGDLVILEGTTTKLSLEIDQPVSQGELRITPTGSDETQTIALNQVGDRLEAELSIEQPATYKIHLVSEETGLVNIFAPKFEIRPVPDLVPKAGFVGLTENTLLLPPNDLLELRGMAEDDLPFETLQQEVSINGEDWQTLNLTSSPVASLDGKKLDAQWQWDLLGHRLKAGDQVVTKLVAIDRKGNRGESVPLRIIVMEIDFDPDRHLTKLKKIGLFDDLLSLSTRFKEQEESASNSIAKLSNVDSLDALRTDLLFLRDTISKQQEAVESVLKKATQLIKEMPAGADAHDLELTARVLSRIQHDHANHANWLTAQIQSGVVTDRKNNLKMLSDRIHRMVDDVKSLAHHFQSIATHDLLSALTSDLVAIKQQQDSIVTVSMDSWDRLLRQHEVVLGRLDQVSKLAEANKQRMPSHVQNALNSLVSWIDAERQKFQQLAETDDNFAQLKAAAVNLKHQLHNRQRMHNIDGGLPQRLVGAKRDFDNRGGSLYGPLVGLASTAREHQQLRNPKSDQDPSQAEKSAGLNRELTLHHSPSLQQFRSRRTAIQSRPDADSQYAADLGLGYRAATHLLAEHQRNQPDSQAYKHLWEIAPAFRTLEAGHELQRTLIAINHLISLERWNAQRTESFIDNPRQWDCIKLGMDFVSLRFRNAQIGNDWINRMNQIRWSTPVRETDRKIGQRRWRQDVIESSVNEVSELHLKLTQLSLELKPIMDEAREVLKKYAPTIAELAKEAAEEIRDLEKETTQTADAVEDNRAEDAEKQVKDLAEKQEQINQKLDELFDALVEDANTQDLLDEEQIQRAKDADRSVAMVKEPAQKMNQALENASQEQDNQDQAKQLSQAAEQQEKTAEALDRVAQHFENLDKGQPADQSRAELNRSEPANTENQPAQNPLDQQFKDAEKLAEMAQKPAEDLMKELEAELQKNPAMQKALSEISKDAVKEAEDALKKAAQQENSIQRANEQSDSSFQEKKNQLAQELRKIGTETTRIMRENVEQANRAAQQGKTTEAQKKLAEAQKQLSEATAKASRAQPNQLLKDLQKTANETKAAIDKAQQALAEAKKETEKGKDQEIHANENTRKVEQTNFERHRKQLRDWEMRNAKQQTRQAESKQRQAENSVRSAENNLRNTNKRLDRAKQMLSKRPDDSNRKMMVKKEEARKKADEQKVAQAKAKQQQAAEDQKQAKAAEAELAKKPSEPLNAKNPATQFADEMTKEAIEKAKKLQAKADELASKTNPNKQLKPNQAQLANAEKQQQQITKDVKELAKELQRASRHEKRLNNQQAAEKLEQSAKKIESAAENESTEAEQQLAKASDEAQQKDADSNTQKSNEKSDPSKPQQSDNQKGDAKSKSKQGKSNQDNKGEASSEPKSGQPQKSKGDPAKSKNSKSNPSKSDQSGSNQDKSKSDPSKQNGNQQSSKSDNKPSGNTEQQKASSSEADQAQQALDKAEQAFAQQAKDLSETRQSLEEANQSNADQSQDTGDMSQAGNEQPQNGQPQNGQPQNGQPQNGQPQNGQPQNGQPQNGQPQNGQPQNGQPQNGQPQNGQPQNGQPQNGQPQNRQPQNGQPQNGQPQNGQPQNGQPNGEQSPQEVARGQQLAQTLDELDRQMAGQAAESGAPANQSGSPQNNSQQTSAQSQSAQSGQPLSSLAQAAQANQASMAAARATAQQQSQLAQSNQTPESMVPTDSNGDPALTGAPKEFSIKDVKRDDREWGKLRGKSAKGNVAGQKDKVSKEYRKKVEAYFKVLAEQAKLKK